MAEFDIDAYINTLNRQENKDAARGALSAMATSGSRGLEAYSNSQKQLETAKSQSAQNALMGYQFGPGGLAAGSAETAVAPIDRALQALTTSRTTFEQDLERQRAANTSYFSKLDASPAFPLLGGGGGGGGGGRGGGGGGGSSYTKAEAEDISLNNARVAMEQARTQANRAATNAARAMTTGSNAGHRSQNARTNAPLYEDASENYRKRQQVLGDLEGARQRAQRALQQTTGRAREEAALRAKAAQDAYAKALQASHEQYRVVQERAPRYAAERPYMDPFSLQSQEANETFAKLGSIAPGVYNEQVAKSFYYGGVPGEIGYSEPIIDPRTGLVTGARNARSMPRIQDLSPSYRQALDQSRAGLDAALIGAQAEMALLGRDPYLITEDDVLTYLNKMGKNTSDERGLAEERDMIARTGYPSLDDQFEAQDLEREAQVRFATGGYASFDDALDDAKAARDFQAIDSGQYTYEGVPYASETEMLDAANDRTYQDVRQGNYAEDVTDRELVDIVNQAGLPVDAGELRELATRMNTDTVTATGVVAQPSFQAVLNRARQYWESPKGADFDPEAFSEWKDLPPDEMFTGAESQYAEAAAALASDPTTAPYWRNALDWAIVGSAR